MIILIITDDNKTLLQILQEQYRRFAAVLFVYLLI